MRKILVLDDSSDTLLELGRILRGWGYEVFTAASPDEAAAHLKQKLDFAIVDLFLAGDQGDELSNEFIDTHLEPRGIPYGRLTSAPKMVPERYEGQWVLHKYEFMHAHDKLRDLLLQSLGG